MSAAGLAGVGKTALAVQAAHTARERGWFSGGVLFIDLHGYDEAAVEPSQALDAMLRALGVPAEHIPFGPVLRGLRRSRGRLPLVRSAADSRQAFLPLLRRHPVRCRAGAAGGRTRAGGPAGPGAGGGAAGVLGAVLRRGGVHPVVGGAGSRSGAGAAVRVLRRGADGDRPVRRCGGEVHRRRGDGGVGHPGGDRGRCGAGRTGSAGPGGRGRRAGRGGWGAGAGGAGGGGDRRGRDDDPGAVGGGRVAAGGRAGGAADRLDPQVRQLVTDAAVLGSTFPAVSGQDEPSVRAALAELVRREVLAVSADPLSPERGSYGFAQNLLRQVAYDTLSRRDRKARHVAVAAHLRAAFPGDGEEVAEVIARHYLDALDAVPDDGDAGLIRGQAIAALTRAAERAGPRLARPSGGRAAHGSRA